MRRAVEHRSWIRRRVPRRAVAPAPRLARRARRPHKRLEPGYVTGALAALLVGVGVAAVYLAGAAVSGRASLLTRRPLLDGLAPPTPYRWVKPPPGLAASNKPPASVRFSVKLTRAGSELGAFSTSDGQVNVVLSEGAVPPSPGQTAVEVTIEPLDPATLGPPPAGLVVAGNAYRIRASYEPSGRRVDAFAGQSSVGLVYPLLATAVGDPGGHLVLFAPDERNWRRLQSTDTPGSHQVSAPLPGPGHVEVGVPAAAAAQRSGGGNRVLLLASAAAALLVAAALLLRRRPAPARSRARRRGPPGGRGRGSGRQAGPPGGGRPGSGGEARGRQAPNPARRRRRR
jgi:hypothetical protein